MIIIQDKYNCCGCEACVHICPIHCISFEEDLEGFFYPSVDVSKCIDCKLCEKVCPILNPSIKTNIEKVFAFKCSDENMRIASSSGGVFLILAKQIISMGGVIFGARFDPNGAVIHDCTATLDSLSLFVGSKYVQSRIGDSFEKCRSFLNQGKMVLFSGTPCQINALNNYLKKNYKNLLTVELICHGVPSPKVWRHYLKELVSDYVSKRKGGTIESKLFPQYNLPKGICTSDEETFLRGISFKNKTYGWNKYSLALTFSEKLEEGVKDIVYIPKPETENPYMRAFICNWISRPSCYRCVFKGGKSSSDITIGDYWGVEKQIPNFDDDKGVSLLVFNTNKGELFFNMIDKSYYISTPVLLEEAMMENPSYFDSVDEPRLRKTFFDLFLEEDKRIDEIVAFLSYVTPLRKCKTKIVNIIKKITRKL